MHFVSRFVAADQSALNPHQEASWPRPEAASQARFVGRQPTIRSDDGPEKTIPNLLDRWSIDGLCGIDTLQRRSSWSKDCSIRKN